MERGLNVYGLFNQMSLFWFTPALDISFRNYSSNQ